MILDLTEREVEWLYTLVYEKDRELKRDGAYPFYRVVHSTRDKLGVLVTKIDRMQMDVKLGLENDN